MSSYDLSQLSSYLMYYDVNNLYNWAMCQSLSYTDFQWVDDLQNFDYTTIALDSTTGYIFEMDMEYPQQLHNKHTDLPFYPTRVLSDPASAMTSSSQHYMIMSYIIATYSNVFVTAFAKIHRTGCVTKIRTNRTISLNKMFLMKT